MTQEMVGQADVYKYQRVDTMINKAKGEVIAEFEKVCPSEPSLKRMVKEMHHIFDQLNKEIKQL